MSHDASHDTESHASTQDRLIRMANQIATFFDSQPENERVDGIATHINKFWEQRMRRQFFEMIDQGHEGFHPLVLKAASRINRPAPPEPLRA